MSSAGEVASEIVIRILDELDPPNTAEAADALRAVVSTANQRIRAAISVDPAREGMGTTLTAGLLAGDVLVLAQVGDSRCYLLRDNELDPAHPRRHVRAGPRRPGRALP